MGGLLDQGRIIRWATKIKVVAACTNPSLPISKPRPERTERRVWDAPAPLRLWHLASLDAPTVALVWSYGFAWAAHISVPAWAPVALALIAWAVYIADRLLDARAGMQSPPLHVLRERHYFHWRYWRFLAPGGVLAALAAAAMVLTRLPAAARVPDTALATATLAYFSGIHSRRRISPALQALLLPLSSRAFLIGILFTAGCLLPLVSQVPGLAIVRVLAIPASFFAVLAWLNCCAIAQWESSDPIRLSKGMVRKAGLLAATGALLALFEAITEPRSALLIAAGTTSALLLALLDRVRHRLTPLAVRAAADLVLLTPALLLVLEPCSK